MDKHTEWVNEDDNCDEIVAELNPNLESDEESENEDVRHNTEPIDLKDALPNIARYRTLANEFGNTTLMNLLAEVVKEYENVTINKHKKKYMLVPISEFFKNI